VDYLIKYYKIHFQIFLVLYQHHFFLNNVEKREDGELNHRIKYTYIIRRIFPFGVSQHQSTDLHGATQTQPFRGWL
jgi:hypothetical protein